MSSFGKEILLIDILLGIMCSTCCKLLTIIVAKSGSETKLHFHFVHFTTLVIMEATNDPWAINPSFLGLGEGVMQYHDPLHNFNIL
jgi:hypothetical protein